MRRAAVITLVVAAGCVKDAPEAARRTHLRASPTERSASLQRWCWDTLEIRALTCSNGTARRSGDTLYVRLANGRDVTFLEDRVSEAPGGYKYVGRISRPALQVIQENGHETPPTWVFVNEASGRSAVVSDEPLISPDSTRFATAAQPDWNNCSERDHPALDVWRFTDTLPVLEWRLAPFDCRRDSGWGATDPQWHGPDTLEFVRREDIVGDTGTSSPSIVEHRSSRAIAVRERTGWRLITARP